MFHSSPDTFPFDEKHAVPNGKENSYHLGIGSHHAIHCLNGSCSFVRWRHDQDISIP